MIQYLSIKILESSNATGIAQSLNGTFSELHLLTSILEFI